MLNLKYPNPQNVLGIIKILILFKGKNLVFLIHDFNRYFAGYADKLAGRNFCVDNKYMLYTIREPVGMCGLITSFNYPLLLASWKLAPSLACGNAIILKPAPQTPLTS